MTAEFLSIRIQERPGHIALDQDRVSITCTVILTLIGTVISSHDGPYRAPWLYMKEDLEIVTVSSI